MKRRHEQKKVRNDLQNNRRVSVVRTQVSQPDTCRRPESYNNAGIMFFKTDKSLLKLGDRTSIRAQLHTELMASEMAYGRSPISCHHCSVNSTPCSLRSI